MNKAKEAKYDEFYTQRKDVDRELIHYSHHFKDKTIYCNCDDPEKSQFTAYFQDNFKTLGIRKLYSTCYHASEQGTGIESNGNTVKPLKLQGDGDFRSKECLEILDKSDIIVTNPPFSLCREYFQTLIDHNKLFLFLTSFNSLFYNNVFPYVKDNVVHPGVTNGSFYFLTPNGGGHINQGNICWLTNLKHDQTPEWLVCTEKYDPVKYPKYDNYDAINVDSLKTIPLDYYGEMGVPASYILKFNPKQFEIIGKSQDLCNKVMIDGKLKSVTRFYLNGKRKYERLVIRRKKEDNGTKV